MSKFWPLDNVHNIVICNENHITFVSKQRPRKSNLTNMELFIFSLENYIQSNVPKNQNSSI